MSSRFVDQPVEALGLVVDRLLQLALDRRAAAVASLQQRAGGAGDRGQRRAQVVRDRAEQRVAQPLGLDRDAAPSRPRSASRARSSPSAAWRASVSQQVELVGAERQQRRRAGRTASTPSTAPLPGKRHVQRGGGRAGCRCRARRAARARTPTAATALVAGRIAERAGRRLERAAGVAAAAPAPGRAAAPTRGAPRRAPRPAPVRADARSRLSAYRTAACAARAPAPLRPAPAPAPPAC